MQRGSFPLVVLLVAACGSSTKSDVAPEQPKPAASLEPAAPPAESKEAPVAADASAAVGKPAPEFKLYDVSGAQHELSQYRGKTVVLEWFNPECPFVKFAHTEGPLEDMAKRQTEGGIVWLAINSGGPGKQGHGAPANEAGAKTYGMAHPILLDETGAVGRAYGAEKTPHVYLIDAQGTLVYRGAIDNAPFGEVDGGGAYVNHLEVAIAALGAGTTVQPAETPAYGCTVKYVAG